MKPYPALFALPSLAIFASQVAGDGSAPTAIKKLAPNSHEKLLAEHLAFAAIPVLGPRDTVSSLWDEGQNRERDAAADSTTQRYRPAFARHLNHAESAYLRRAAARALLLHRREACPAGTSSCADIGSSDKCCQEGTYCVSVEDSSVGNIACCPDAASCGGGVGACPSGATSCSEDLGGGCCIPGYVCEGAGCVPSASATGLSSSASSTAVQDSTQEQAETTTTTTSVESTEEQATSTTTEIETTTTSEEPTTSEETTSSERATATETATTEDSTRTITGTATGGAPFRPISSETTASATDTSETQTGCPTGYYGCLATHGGGCCRTDRQCNTYDCPSPSTTLVSGGITIVLLATDAPPAAGAGAGDATSTCADGWFLCGRDAGTVAGCCPSDYSCGTASCFTVTASHTAKVQKEFPEADVATRCSPRALLVGAIGALCLLIVI
ncbi:hypothetical protein B0J13DRAFT_551459 [Dactylonectria estremocensis]|uniref:Gpi anchored protein n=1 Tax=Dactylonectria estremocensis TaxID=1079267 RepID=A0A9P9J9N4_9HYPO|nr:hypothetical protein B0J13DRAFT_551459 [Dactylonectria estremocensis]